MESKLYSIKKPCVIENEYYAVGDVYGPSDHMSCVALKELIGHGFLEEKPLVMDTKVKIEDRLMSMQTLCGHLQHYINELIKELNEARDYWKYLQMDVKKVDKWIAPTENGAPLLCMPNIPKPLHSLAPRIIEGQARWNIMRTKCYMEANYTCQACGEYLGAGKCEAHELYSIDWGKQLSQFERCVCLCKECMDEDTEVLTTDGWIKLPEITTEHKVACWDKDTRQITFGHPTGTVVSKHDEAIKIIGHGATLYFSPNHRLALKVASKQSPTHNEVVDVLAKDYKASHYYNWLTGGHTIGYRSLSDEERVYIAIEADGSMTYDKEHPHGKEGRSREYRHKSDSNPERYTYAVKLKKKRKISRLLLLLKSSSLPYRISESEDGYTVFTIWTDVNCKRFSDCFEMTMPSQKAEEFMEELVKWDGTCLSAVPTWFSSRKEEVDFVQGVAAQCNQCTHVRVDYRQGKKPSYIVSIRKKHNEYTAKQMKVEVVAWHKPMYCITVPTSYFVARRDGMVFITGNCHQFIHSGRTFSMYQRGEKLYNKYYLQKIAKKAFEVISAYNNMVPEEQKLRMYGTIMEWLKDKELGKWLEPMINHYDVRLYGAKKAYEDKDHWNKWRLIYNSKEYEPKYKDAKEWMEAMNGSN